MLHDHSSGERITHTAGLNLANPIGKVHSILCTAPGSPLSQFLW